MQQWCQVFGKAESAGKNPPKDQSLAIFRKVPNSSLRINNQDSICMLGLVAACEEKPSNKNTDISVDGIRRSKGEDRRWNYNIDL